MPSRAGMGAALPDLGAGQYLWAALVSLGPVRAVSGGGRRPADWPEIAGFAQATGPWARWELSLLRDMACAYLSGLECGEDPMGKDPAEDG